MADANGPGTWANLTSWIMTTLASALLLMFGWQGKRLIQRVDELEKNKLDTPEHEKDIRTVTKILDRLHDKVDDSVEFFKNEHMAGRQKADENHKDVMQELQRYKDDTTMLIITSLQKSRSEDKDG